MTNPLSAADSIGVVTDVAALEAGTTSDIGTLTGAEQVAATRGSGLFQTTLTKVAQWILQTFQGFTQSGTNATAQSVQSKLQQVVSVADFASFDPTGVADSTTAILNAAASLGVAGGVITIPAGAKVLINSNLTLPANVGLVGPYYFVGTPGSNSAVPYGNLGALLLNPAKTITLSSGATISGCLIYPVGMTFPQTSTAGWTGTAVKFGGDDAGVFNSMILGFNKAIYSSGYQRPRVSYLMHDNINGIEITNAADVPYISDCHAWPFTTIAAGGADSNLKRSGIAYYLHDLVDDGKVTNCFAYGYVTGFQVTNANTVQLVSCTADNTNTANLPDNAGSQGFVISGASQDTLLLGCQASSMYQTGININTSAGDLTKIFDCNVWGTNGSAISTAAGIAVNSGDVVIGCVLRNHTNGISVNNAASIVHVLPGTRFDTVSQMINATVATTNVFLNSPQFAATIAAGQQVDVGSVTAASIASATTISLPMNGNVFTITGTTNISGIYGGYLGRLVVLVFSAALTVVAGTGSQTSLSLSAGYNFTAAANSALTLFHNGTQWVQVGSSGQSAGVFTSLNTLGQVFFGDSSGSTSTVTVSAPGSNGANVLLAGNGSTTPNKTVRAQNGQLQVLNSGYTAAILTLDDTGDLTIPGNFDVSTAGFGLRVKEGSNAKQGVATLVAGTVVVTNTSITATSRVFLTAQDNNTTGSLRVSARTAGTSFTITSSNSTDTGVVAYEIFEAG